MLPAFGRTALAAFDWAGFKSRFVTSDGRVVDSGNGGISHSEGQGFALLMAEAAGDAEAFERIWRWTDATLSRADVRLFSWRYDPSAGRVTDANNASDGDIIIAWALERAGIRWKRAAYRQAAAAIRGAVRSRLVVRHRKWLLLMPGLEGFAHADGSLTINPSYLVFPAFDAFHAADQRAGWEQLAIDSLGFLEQAQFGTLDLPIDWVRVDSDGRVWADPDRPSRFGFDAVRIPLYLRWARRRNARALRAATRWWMAASAPHGAVPAWVDVASGATAPYPASPGMQAVARFVTAGEAPLRMIGAEDYYSAALTNLVALASAAK